MKLVDQMTELRGLHSKQEEYASALEAIQSGKEFLQVSIHGGQLPGVSLVGNEDGKHMIVLGIIKYYRHQLDKYTALVDQAIAKLKNERF